MKAAICTNYGAPDVVKIETLVQPEVKEDEVLVKVMATTVNSGDSRIRGLNVPTGFRLIMRLALGFTRPRNSILGTELSGVVCAIGSKVNRFAVGDEVFADCGMQMGAHAQYRVFKQTDSLLTKPSNLSLTQSSAIIFAASTAYYFLHEKAHLKAQERILINGASAAVGLAAVQLAKHMGAHITAVCSGKNADLVKSLGAHEVIDYQQQAILNDSIHYDVIMDNIGNINWQVGKRSLRDNGRLLKVVASLAQTLQAPWVSMFSQKKCFAGTAFPDIAMLEALKELVELGAYKPIIDKTYSLNEIQSAYAYVDSNRKVGSVVVLCQD